MIIEVLIYLLLLVTVVPVSLFLAKLCDDELVKDRIYFRLVSYVLIVLAVVSLILELSLSIILALVYMVLLLEILIYKSKHVKIKNRKK